MATTYNPTFGIEAEPKSSFLGKVFHRILEARQEEAKRTVQEHLRIFAPDTLRSVGYTEAEIKAIYNKSVI